MLRVAVLFLNGGCASTALLPMEIFRNAGVLWNLLNNRAPVPRFHVTTASVRGEPVVTDHLVSLTPSCALEEVDRPDIVFVPAGGLPFETLLRTGYVLEDVIERNRPVIPWLRSWASDGARIAGVCSGVALLAEAGLLDGKRATTHWGLVDSYRSRFPQVDWQPEYLITDSGDVFCGGGINSAADLSLYLVERFSSRDLARECAKALLIEMPRMWQVTFADAALRKDHNDEIIRRAQDWMHEHFCSALSMDAVAARVGMSPRNFIRRFKAATGRTPLSYVHTIRITMAKRFLEDGQQTIQAVSQAVGYDDVIFFRDLFKRHTGLCPTEYRSRFGPPPGTAIRNTLKLDSMSDSLPHDTATHH
ncbi:GlxA family transcriptional regulator [Microvirga puerhi]|uniref:Helix-turn-helix domain-containing protein n=1 Tax=Microvirga puerhi TaxID=2876078 RepID=A0ABS7VM98_9HYPH|nr:helix-turn-helix domain-containing protein [Microvirga puerhi]MBZ6076663.1 helix-turn-helix domain-containing protein [Microvirga puerhi]